MVFEGKAEVDVTNAMIGLDNGLAYNQLGRTGLAVSQAGFGCYRVDDATPAHRIALSGALQTGINLIDTSANYTGGGSERLVGKVLAELIAGGAISREQVVVVTKGGYLQGENYAISQQRKAQGKPYPDLVEYATGLEHCIHPEFLAEQISRSLERMGLDCIDVYLIHNPEYYLAWAKTQGVAPMEARAEYLRRIELAFEYLETEAAAGRIQYYGLSSNTFPTPADDFEHTPLADICGIAAKLGPENHFAVVEMPLNILEPQAANLANQPGGESVIEFAAAQGLGVLINRPLNAVTERQMIRLSGFPDVDAPQPTKIIQGLDKLADLEDRGRELLMESELDPALVNAIFNALPAAGGLRKHWDGFGGLEQWRTTRDSFLRPRMDFVSAQLNQYTTNAGLGQWLEQWRGTSQDLHQALDELYVAMAAKQAGQVRQALAKAAPQWAESGTLSQTAIRAVRSAPGVSSVLVGMRSPDYVKDVLTELLSPSEPDGGLDNWRAVAAMGGEF